jgi:UDP:flavonoid glycosyltransferase YjiC (YdhE family)
VAVVVHHAGAGTTAAGLRAGIPAVPVPFAYDQPFWARRLHDLGVAPRVVPARRVTPTRLAAAIEAAVGPELVPVAAGLAGAVGSEDGARRMLELTEAVTLDL